MRTENARKFHFILKQVLKYPNYALAVFFQEIALFFLSYAKNYACTIRQKPKSSPTVYINTKSFQNTKISVEICILSLPDFLKNLHLFFEMDREAIFKQIANFSVISELFPQPYGTGSGKESGNEGSAAYKCNLPSYFSLPLNLMFVITRI